MNKAILVPFEEKYREGVINCLRRNYEWMGEAPTEKVEKWIEPLLTYSWIEKSGTGFEHGGVLLDGDEVVGFLGMIFSKRRENGYDYIYANPSTWAIDKGYRIYDFSFSKKLYGLANVISDFSAGNPELEKAVKYFKFQKYDCESFVFKPTLLGSNLKLVMLDINSITDGQIRKEFMDHKKYNVDCIKLIDKNGNECTFFLQCRKMQNSRINAKCVRVLKCSDYTFLSNNIKSVIRKLVLHYRAFYIKVDSRFINGSSEIMKMRYYVVHGNTLLLDKCNIIEKPLDLLYSEEVIL